MLDFPNSIEHNDAHFFRCTVSSIFTFPHMFSKGTTELVLKAPKTKTSVRKVFLPKTVALMLAERKKQIDELKELFGEEYSDYTRR